MPSWEAFDFAANGPQAGPRKVKERRKTWTHYLLSPPNHYPATLATLPRPAQHHHPADAIGMSRAHTPAHARG